MIFPRASRGSSTFGWVCVIILNIFVSTVIRLCIGHLPNAWAQVLTSWLVSKWSKNWMWNTLMESASKTWKAQQTSLRKMKSNASDGVWIWSTTRFALQVSSLPQWIITATVFPSMHYAVWWCALSEAFPGEACMCVCGIAVMSFTERVTHRQPREILMVFLSTPQRDE